MSESTRDDSARRSFAPIASALKLAALVGMLGLATCSGPEGRSLEELVRDGGLYFEPETMQPYTGVAFATFEAESDVVAKRLNLWNGAYRGPFERYFRDGDLSSMESYVDGVRHGPYRWYFESGELFEEGTYEDGRRDGPYRAYWQTGDLYEEGTYRHGEFDGPRRWYRNGRLVEMVTYDLGIMDGLYERYLDDGTLDLKGMLQAGNPCGVWFEAERTISYPACGSYETE